MGHGEVEQGGNSTLAVQGVRRGFGRWVGLQRTISFEGEKEVETVRE